MASLSEKFRDAFRSYPAGVALLTARVDGRPAGMTISSLASLSLDPLALTFNISRDTGIQSELLKADSFMIHLLATRHSDLADSFARPDGDRFTAAQGWDVVPTGEPYLPDAPFALRARPLHILKVGGSSVVAAEVLGVLEGPAGEPLLYQNRTFLGISQTVPLS